jgi:signal transduction histidine kinase
LREGDPAVWAERLAERIAPPLQAQGAVFQVRIEAADAAYLFDPQALESVVLNFIDNAVKFSPGEKEIELSGGSSAAGYRVEVSDRGIGIDPQEQSQMFGRFYRGEAAREGAAPGVGLGLHIASQIADRHGAALYARSRVGGGSVFGVELKREV